MANKIADNIDRVIPHGEMISDALLTIETPALRAARGAKLQTLLAFHTKRLSARSIDYWSNRCAVILHTSKSAYNLSRRVVL